MALRISVGNEDLAMSRFAISPLWELTCALRRLADAESGRRRPAPVLEPWLARARSRYQALAREADIDVIHALDAPHYGVDFLSPVPADVSTTIEDLLGQVRSTPADQAHREIAEVLRRHPVRDPRVRQILASGGIAGYAADVLAVAWQFLLEPQWPALRAILERDVVHRAGQLAASGWAAALADLTSHLRWHAGRIECGQVAEDIDAELDGRGLLFVAFGLCLARCRFHSRSAMAAGHHLPGARGRRAVGTAGGGRDRLRARPAARPVPGRDPAGTRTAGEHYSACRHARPVAGRSR